jgi:hypothetical protein
MLTQCCCRGCVNVLGAGGRPTDLDRPSGALDAEKPQTSEPSPSPTGESDGSTQRR